MSTMPESSTPQASSSGSSASNFQPIFEKAIKEYKKKTGEDLTNHPLAAEINGCGSPDAILTVLQAKANDLDQRTDERLTKWLTPTVNVLNVLSATLGPGVGLVSFSKLPHHLPTYLRLNAHLAGISPHQYHLFWNQYFPCREFHCAIFLQRCDNISP